MVPKVAPARRECRSPLLGHRTWNGEIGEARTNVARACPVSEEDQIDFVGRGPFPGYPGEIVKADHAVDDNARGTADGDPALLPPGIDGQHRHRNDTWTGPTV